MISFRNITNGFVRLERAGKVFLGDPWIADRLFDGGWTPYPPIRDPEGVLSRCDYLFISHIDQDHFDHQALARIPRTCKAILPHMWPNHIIEQQLRKLGFNDIVLVKANTPTPIDSELTVEIIPPLNGFAQEFERYGKGVPAVAIDAGIALTWGDIRIVLLSDNTPYDLTPIHDSLSRLEGCDLLALNYNGAADDWPICYRGHSEADAAALSERRDAKKLRSNEALIAWMKPRAVVPYSSEFSVRGRQAMRFAQVCTPLVACDKKRMAELLQSNTGVPAFALYEEDVLELDKEGARFLPSNVVIPTLLERAAELSHQERNYAALLPAPGEPEAVLRDAATAAEHMFAFMDRFQLKSEWCIEVSLEGAAAPFSVDMLHRRTGHALVPADRKVLRCFTDWQYFAALVRRLTHWNNAIISYNLEWERVPNEFDIDLYRALSFFHV